MSKTVLVHKGTLASLMVAMAAFVLLFVCAGCSSQTGTDGGGDTATAADVSLKSYLVWSPFDSDTPNFHVPEPFGILIFG